MILIYEITIYETLFLLLTIIGGFFALLQWRQSNKLKRAELIKESIEKTRDDSDVVQVLYSIDYGENGMTLILFLIII